MARIPITDLGGSIVQGRAPSELQPGEYADLVNFFQHGGKLRRRGGTRRLNPVAHTSRLTGIFTYRPNIAVPGGFDCGFGTPNTFAKMVSGVITDLTAQAGFGMITSNLPWTMFQYKGIWYGIRYGAGLVRSDGSYYGPAGIDAPAVAPTLAAGAAGNLTAANYKGVYTFYNGSTGMESNPSPVSNTLALGANLKINWSGIATSPNRQVTSRRLYRTLPDQGGEYFLVDEIEDNSSTTFVGDNVLAQDLDTAVSMSNGTPPPGTLIGDVWKERLFLSDGIDLFHSEDGLIEAFDPDNIIPVFPDDGHQIKAVHAHGDRLIVGKTNKIHYLVGSDPSTFALLTLTDRHGCVSHHTMQSAEGYLFWLGSDNVYRSDGNSVTGIASVKLRDVIEGMNHTAALSATATVFPELGWYILTIPGYVQLCYNYRTDVWTTVPTAADMQIIGDFYDTSREQQIFVTDDQGYAYRFHDTTYGYDDRLQQADPIAAGFTTRAFGAEAGTKHVLTHALLLCPRYNENITLTAISEAEVIKSRTVSLNLPHRWKLYNLSTRHQAKGQTQLQVVYTGPTAIELEGFALDLEPIGRPTMQAA